MSVYSSDMASVTCPNQLVCLRRFRFQKDLHVWFFVSALASNSGGRGVESFNLNSQPAHPTPRVLYVLRVWESSQKHQFNLFVEVTNVLVEGLKANQFLSAMHLFFRFPMLCNVRIQRRRWVEQKCSFGFAPFHLTIMKTRKKDQE